MFFCVKTGLREWKKVGLALQKEILSEKMKISKYGVIGCYIDVCQVNVELLKTHEKAIKNAACCVA